jgi:hypothetical protein
MSVLERCWHQVECRRCCYQSPIMLARKLVMSRWCQNWLSWIHEGASGVNRC